jgi:hypothetical protein
MLISREYEETYYNICKWWEEITQLKLEFADYKKIAARDVNYWRLNLVNCWKPKYCKVYGNQQPSLDYIKEGSETIENTY